jgi:hypothetical protein
MTSELGFTKQTNGVLLVLAALVGAIAFFTVVRPQRPSPFSAGSGFGTGFGTESLMVGASSRLGAAR